MYSRIAGGCQKSHILHVVIFSQSIHTFLINLKRRHSEIFEAIEKELVDRYLTEKALSCFWLVKPSESGKTLERVARDLFALVRRFREHEEVKSQGTVAPSFVVRSA
jgi:hypothetical protein